MPTETVWNSETHKYETKNQETVSQMKAWQKANLPKLPKAGTPARGRDWEKWQRANLARPRKYTVQGGDSWSTIAQQIYGDPRMAAQLARANGDVLTIHPGMVLKLPSAPRPGTTPYIAPGWGGTQAQQPTTGGTQPTLPQPAPASYAPASTPIPVRGDPRQYYTGPGGATRGGQVGGSTPIPPKPAGYSPQTPTMNFPAAAPGTATNIPARGDPRQYYTGAGGKARGGQVLPAGGSTPIPQGPQGTQYQATPPTRMNPEPYYIERAIAGSEDILNQGRWPSAIWPNTQLNAGWTNAELQQAGYEWNGSFWQLMDSTAGASSGGGGGGGGYSGGGYGGGGGGGGGNGGWSTPYSPYSQQASGRTLDALSQGLITWRI